MDPLRLAAILVVFRGQYKHPKLADIFRDLTYCSDVDHDQHHCDARLCSFPCQLCKRLCAHTDHLHGLQGDAIHLCGFVNGSSILHKLGT
jgi:hypothetical protein